MGSGTESENVPFENVRALITSGLLPVAVMVTGCLDTSPDDPLKVSAEVERERGAVDCVAAQTWLAISIVAREREILFSTTSCSWIGDTENEVTSRRYCKMP